MSYIRQLLIRQALRHKTNRPSGLIGQYKPYLNSNDSPTRDILKDYSGQGHDIQLYNFGYALGSGYGSWAQDFSSYDAFPQRGEVDKISHNSFHVSNITENDGSLLLYKYLESDIPSYKIRVTGLKEGERVEYRYLNEDNVSNVVNIDENGIYTLPKSVFFTDKAAGFSFKGPLGSRDITIEQIPEYPGALVGDGVDDYGICTTPFGEVGTVIVMLDEINWETSRYLYDTGGTIDNGRIYCLKSGTITGGLPSKPNIFDGKFTVFTRDPLNVTNKFNLFTAGKNHISVALYGMELYSKKLTDEEIQSVKEAMIKEYEKETGNKLEGI